MSLENTNLINSQKNCIFSKFPPLFSQFWGWFLPPSTSTISDKKRIFFRKLHSCKFRRNRWLTLWRVYICALLDILPPPWERDLHHVLQICRGSRRVDRNTGPTRWRTRGRMLQRLRWWSHLENISALPFYQANNHSGRVNSRSTPELMDELVESIRG